MQQSKPHTDWFGRVVGMLILVAGIALLGFVFNTANTLFHSPIKGFTFLNSQSTSAPPAANIGAAALEFVKQIVFLGLMTVVGSILAGKGIALYLGAIQWGETHHPSKPSHVDVEPRPTPAPSTPDTPPSTAKATPKTDNAVGDAS
jgi:hypothetical protein